MKKIFNNSKRGMAVILTLCILIGIAGTCVHAAVVDETTQVAHEPTQELMPMITRACDENEYSTRTWDSLDAAKEYYGSNWEYKSCNYTHTNGVTYNYYYTMNSGARVYIYVS